MTTPSAHSLPRCPVEVTLSLISSRWVVLILRELIYGTRRFGQIRKALGGVSTKVLTQNLRTMEENGLLTRETFAEVPPRVEYTLTALGQSLRPVLLSMVEWGSQYARLHEHRSSVRCDTGEVLMVGWMDDEALRRTLTQGRVTFWSRSRREYWRKGDTSGHHQYVRSVALDCDGDALLVRVNKEGPACHLGTDSCFDGNLIYESEED